MGSDSQSTVSPAEELRWLEYQQRLRKRRRGVLAAKTESHVGTRLWRDAAQNGARALASRWAALRSDAARIGSCWTPSIPRWREAAADAALDRLLFAGADKAIRDVMVGGEWVIKGGRHGAESARRGF